MADYRICTRCIMDTSDPDITFDESGICNHCINFDTVIVPQWYPNTEGAVRLNALADRIKSECKDQDYDCIIGLSGGVDSSYLAYKIKEMGLRPLAVHVDAGWNSELAAQNIESIVKKLDIDLYTDVVNWEEVRDLQRAFLKANVANQDIPQDHAFFAGLYRYAVKNNIRYVMSGSNYATESVLPTGWGYNAMDLRHLMGIHRKFGKKKLKTYPRVSFWKYYFYYPYVKRMAVIRPLNYMPYGKAEAIAVLEKELGWKYYGGKHYESRFTKFFQAYYLPVKFGYDKRRAHLSSLVLSGQMTRDEALATMQEDIYPQKERKEDRAFVLKKLGFTEDEFNTLMAAPKKTYKDYPSNENLFALKDAALKLLSALGVGRIVKKLRGIP